MGIRIVVINPVGYRGVVHEFDEDELDDGNSKNPGDGGDSE